MDALEHDDPIAEPVRRPPGVLDLPSRRARQPPRRAAAEQRTFARGADDVAEHGARLDRRQLARIADQDQPRGAAQGLDQARHQRQRHHRGLIDDHDVVREALVAVVAKAAVAPRPPAEQTVHRRRLQIEQRGANPLVDLEPECLGADGLLQPRRGLAGRRRERDQRQARVRRRATARTAARRSARRSSSCPCPGRRRRPRTAAAPPTPQRGSGARRGRHRTSARPRARARRVRRPWPAWLPSSPVRGRPVPPRSSNGRGTAMSPRAATAARWCRPQRPPRRSSNPRPRRPSCRAPATRASRDRPVHRCRRRPSRGSKPGPRARDRSAAREPPARPRAGPPRSRSPAIDPSRRATWTSAADSTPARLNSRSRPEACWT